MIRKAFLIVLLFASVAPVRGQRFGDYVSDESILYAQTKQVNQFFRRFNGEESLTGVRYYRGDKYFRDPDFRRRYLNGIFDQQNQAISDRQKRQFISDALSSTNPLFLDFHSAGWFAEVATVFNHNGKDVRVTLFLKLEQENLGYKWVINDVFYKPFTDLFSLEDDGKLIFLHPMSHELDFMNLIKVFQDKEKIAKYAEKGYKPSYLTLLLYELKRGNMKFVTVENVKFHFFQISGWYFELSDQRRNGPNAGWLITALAPINEKEKELLLKYIYNE